MEKRPVFLLLLSSCIAFGQEKMERIAPQDLRFHDILGELGNPLLGRLIMVINYRVIHEGSCLFYLNEAKAKNLFYFIEKPYDLRAGVYLEDHGVLLRFHPLEFHPKQHHRINLLHQQNQLL